jgi:signal transduction histidine kinase
MPTGSQSNQINLSQLDKVSVHFSTDHKQTIQKQETNESLVGSPVLSRLTDQLPFGVFELDSYGFFLYCNSQFQSLCNRSTATPSALHLNDLVAATDAATDPWEQARAGTTVCQEVRLRQNSSRWLRLTLQPTSATDGTIRYLGSATDLTREKRQQSQNRALKKLRQEIGRLETPEELSQILAGMHHYLEDLDANIASYGINIVGEAELRFHGKNTGGSWHERSSRKGDDIVRRIWQSGLTAYRRDLLSQDEYGELDDITTLFGGSVRSIIDIPFSHGTLALNSHDPDSFSADDIAFLEDLATAISEGFHRRDDLQNVATKELQLRQARKLEAVGLLAGGIAHDFNNLITIISGYGQLLLYELDSDDPRRISAEEISEASQRAEMLVQQLLLFSRRKQASTGPVDLNQVVDGLERLIQPLIGDAIILTTRLDADAMPIIADQGQLDQVLMNLSINARDAMPTGGRLTISTSNAPQDQEFFRDNGLDPKAYAQLCVSDTGIGMDDQTRQQIFDPFFTTKSQDEGTGLGLAIVHSIIKESKGEIKVSSQPGQGTSFYIYLPLCTKALSQVHPTSTVPLLDGGPETILLVEDDDMVRRLTRRFLSESGYNVLEAIDGTNALSVFEDHPEPISLLLTDVIMPGMNGQDLGKRLRTQSPELKVIYMSGYTDHTIERHGLHFSDLAFLQKPFTYNVLANKVRQILDDEA